MKRSDLENRRHGLLVVVLGGIVAVIGSAAAGDSRAPSPPAPAPRYHTAEIIEAPDWGGTDRGPMDPMIAPYDPLTAAGFDDQVRARFRGTYRRAAKTSVSDARTEPERTIDELVTTLVDDKTMLALHPPITNSPDSARVEVEERSVRVRGWIYAIRYEDDQDWHLIVGTHPDERAKMFLNCEVSGLPSNDISSYASLLAVRQSLAHMFDNDLPGPGRYAKYTKPIPVTIEGMLLFNVDHPAGAVGPPAMRPATAWAIHPITKIELGAP